MLYRFEVYYDKKMEGKKQLLEKKIFLLFYNLDTIL